MDTERHSARQHPVRAGTRRSKVPESRVCLRHASRPADTAGRRHDRDRREGSNLVLSPTLSDNLKSVSIAIYYDVRAGLNAGMVYVL